MAIPLQRNLDDDFMTTSSWIERFKKRNNIHFTKSHSEKIYSICQLLNRGSQVYPTRSKEFHDDCIYNADETGLFYKAVPSGSLIESRSGKFSKDSLMVLLPVNQSRTDKQTFIVADSGNPRCFKHKKVPVPYFHNKRSRMTSEI